MGGVDWTSPLWQLGGNCSVSAFLKISRGIHGSFFEAAFLEICLYCFNYFLEKYEIQACY